MLTLFWAAKGGAGTTTVAAAAALVGTDGRTLLVDGSGDLPDALGLGDSPKPGLADWMAAGPDVPADGLAHLEEQVTDGVSLIRRGAGPLPADRVAVLAALLAEDPRRVVVDGGVHTAEMAPIGPAAGRSILVTRACYLALRRASKCPARPTDVVLVTEPGRALGRREVAAAAGAPVLATVAWDPTIGRAVDAGLLTVRLPRSLARAVSSLAP